MSSERQLLESEGRWWGEHVHRYHEAIQLISPTHKVLDIACGTGFGTDILSQHTSELVVGGDISEQAIKYCQQEWKRPNIVFKVLDGTALAFPDQYFDRIVSFETIEHTTKYQQMLAEFYRVLKPGGLLILSTPNAAITSSDGVIGNPFHTQEFHYGELKTILKERFPEVKLFGQYYKRYSKKGEGTAAGKLMEKLFLSFGIRKLPYRLRSSIMKKLFNYPLYPRENDFVLESDEAFIIKNCPVLFATCKR